MPMFLNTRGMSTLAIAICDRCRMKRPLASMGSDPNVPGLRVCNKGCRDRKDPWRLPARQPEKIALNFPRPDVDIAETGNTLATGDYGTFEIAVENTDDPTTNGNMDSLEI